SPNQKRFRPRRGNTQGPDRRRNSDQENWANRPLRSTRTTSRWLIYKNCGVHRLPVEPKTCNKLRARIYPSGKYHLPPRLVYAPNPAPPAMRHEPPNSASYPRRSATSSTLATPQRYSGYHPTRREPSRPQTPG